MFATFNESRHNGTLSVFPLYPLISLPSPTTPNTLLAPHFSPLFWLSRCRLAQDLRDAFPAMSGFSRTNLFYMCQVYNAWSTFDMPVQQAVGLIPWSHHLVIVSKVSEPSARLFYLQETITHCWSRAVLTAQIETGLHTRQGRALSNFSLALPSPQSDLAQQTLKDPYVFDFLSLSKDAQERDLEQGLIEHIQKFLLELGAGFSGDNHMKILTGFIGFCLIISCTESDYNSDFKYKGKINISKNLILENGKGSIKVENTDNEFAMEIFYVDVFTKKDWRLNISNYIVESGKFEIIELIEGKECIYSNILIANENLQLKCYIIEKNQNENNYNQCGQIMITTSGGCIIAEILKKP